MNQIFHSGLCQTSCVNKAQSAATNPASPVQECNNCSWFRTRCGPKWTVLCCKKWQWGRFYYHPVQKNPSKLFWGIFAWQVFRWYFSPIVQTFRDAIKRKPEQSLPYNFLVERGRLPGPLFIQFSLYCPEFQGIQYICEKCKIFIWPGAA